jgi:hypothetical protein
MPGLADPTEQFLSGILNNPQQFLGGFAPGGQQQSNLLQQRTGNAFQQTLNASPQNRTLDQFRQIMGTGAGQQGPAIDIPDVSGANVIGAAQPVFQRNLQQSLQRQREFGGPRFASESGRQARQLESESLQDFNLFQQNVLESGLNRQLGAAQLGVQQSLGRRGLDLQQQAQRQQGILGAMGLDTQQRGQDIQQQLGLGNLSLGFGGLNQQNFGQQLAFLAPLLQAAFQGGGAFSGPIFTQSPSTGEQIFGAIGGLGSTAAQGGLFG